MPQRRTRQKTRARAQEQRAQACTHCPVFPRARHLSRGGIVDEQADGLASVRERVTANSEAAAVSRAAEAGAPAFAAAAALGSGLGARGRGGRERERISTIPSPTPSSPFLEHAKMPEGYARGKSPARPFRSSPFHKRAPGSPRGQVRCLHRQGDRVDPDAVRPQRAAQSRRQVPLVVLLVAVNHDLPPSFRGGVRRSRPGGARTRAELPVSEVAARATSPGAVLGRVGWGGGYKIVRQVAENKKHKSQKGIDCCTPP